MNRTHLIKPSWLYKDLPRQFKIPNKKKKTLERNLSQDQDNMAKQDLSPCDEHGDFLFFRIFTFEGPGLHRAKYYYQCYKCLFSQDTDWLDRMIQTDQACDTKKMAKDFLMSILPTTTTGDGTALTFWDRSWRGISPPYQGAGRKLLPRVLAPSTTRAQIHTG